MKILLHVCCAPCSIYPIRLLREEGFDLMGFFYKHNIHPYTECLKRQETLEMYAETENFRVIYQDGYELEEFIRNVVFRESNRCAYCYHDRLRSTALMAKRGKFDYFTTTLLYSKFQKHEMIKEIGESLGKKIGVRFLYRDFRAGWKQGIEESKRLGMYRQQYCGCIYSEKQRFFK
ncbi:epoxyqueuosine reductase QueH [Desulfonema magnum]|uniref:Epoxyqueuosine reductase QueH n=1 Tax=Desulfonema magnum TaxID=45655 RepID=A0A975BIH1_9BACT|nr:epoxyqueuosine reductase QueH [Desulfonema magnum]QTA86137.1 Epoxyqueuosine reductase family protein [Desulfonema magnum]